MDGNTYDVVVLGAGPVGENVADRVVQGHAIRPSEQVVEAPARALHPEAPERDHLYRLGFLRVTAINTPVTTDSP